MSKKRLITLLSSVLVTLLLIGAMVITARLIKSAPPVYSTVSPYILTDSNGEYFNSGDIKDKLYVTNFIFTRCPDLCPRLTHQMKQIQSEFSKEEDLHFVSISVDPTYDTPERLLDFAKKYKADPHQWHFLTGDEDRIKKIMVEEFKIGFADKPVFHSDRFVLVDGHAQIRGYYTMDPKSIKQLTEDIDYLLAHR